VVIEGPTVLEASSILAASTIFASNLHPLRMKIVRYGWEAIALREKGRTTSFFFD
jgi:hypothetical protein